MQFLSGVDKAANQIDGDRTERQCLSRVRARISESAGTVEALCTELHRADCQTFTPADHAGSAEQSDARRWPNNATRLSGNEWLWAAKRA